MKRLEEFILYSNYDTMNFIDVLDSKIIIYQSYDRAYTNQFTFSEFYTYAKNISSRNSAIVEFFCINFPEYVI